MMSEDLVGPSEIAELLGVTRRTAARYMKRPDFPKPLGRIAASPIWRHRDVEKWGEEHLPLPTGRPRRKHEPTETGAP
jgi:prophage regulatory protein